MLRAILILLLALTAGLPVQASAKPTLEDYGRLPDFEDAAISPDGKRHALILNSNNKRELLIVENKKVLRGIALGSEKIRGLGWATNDLVMLDVSNTEDLARNFNVRKAEMTRTLFLPVSDRKAGTLFAKQQYMSPMNFGFYGLREIDGKRYGFFAGVPLKEQRDSYGLSYYLYYGGNPNLYRVDFDNYSIKEVAEGSAEILDDRSWLVGSNGALLATLILTDNGKWTLIGHQHKIKLKGVQQEGRVYMAGLLEGGRYLVLGEAAEGQRTNLFSKVDLSSGTRTPYLTDEQPIYFYVNHLTGEIFGYETKDKGPVFSDPTIAKRRAKIERAFPKLHRRIIDYDDDFTKVVLETNGNGDSGTYWQVDLAALSASPLGWQRENIPPAEVGKISTVTYKASDGLEMDGILTLPPGREAKNLPAIMLPHGGPRAHDEEVFDWWAQSFASRGYAVFQPNFRGSTGRGQQFLEAGYGQWGRKMQTDISDGLAHLAKQGIVDSDRACIMGASYGGYAALAGVTLQKGIYRCAVSVNGLSDLSRMVASSKAGGLGSKMLKNDLARLLGSKSDMNAVSPRRFAASANAPVLLVHGKDDTVVAYEQSKAMANALKKEGKPYELVTLEGEDHWLSKSETRLKMLSATVAFVEKHNPAQ